MSAFPPRTMIIVISVLLLAAGGCARSRPSRYYVLSGVAGSQANREVGAAESNVSIAIGPIELPLYLDRPQIVTRSSENRLELAEFDRWAEPLKESIPRVLAENLGSLLNTDRVVMSPWKGSTEVDYRIAVTITRFDGPAGGKVMLVARWTIIDGDGRRILLVRKAHIVEPVTSLSYEAYAGAGSRALASLGREIAAAIKSIP